MSENELRDFLRALGGDYAAIADRGNRRPLVPDNQAHVKILERLKSVSVVRRYDRDGKRGGLRVFLRQP